MRKKLRGPMPVPFCRSPGHVSWLRFVKTRAGKSALLGRLHSPRPCRLVAVLCDLERLWPALVRKSVGVGFIRFGIRSRTGVRWVVRRCARKRANTCSSGPITHRFGLDFATNEALRDGHQGCQRTPGGRAPTVSIAARDRVDSSVAIGFGGSGKRIGDIVCHQRLLTLCGLTFPTNRGRSGDVV